jgi:Gpi18-like mannosyltransferase
MRPFSKNVLNAMVLCHDLLYYRLHRKLTMIMTMEKMEIMTTVTTKITIINKK